MDDRAAAHRTWVPVLRSIARVWSVASITLIVAFIAGEGVNASTPHEWLGLLFFPLGICLGMVMAWRREGAGGAITVVSLVIFYIIHVATTGAMPAGWAWLAFAAPGFLFLACRLASGANAVTGDRAATGS